MYLVSSCLAGIRCRYDGKCSENEHIIEMVKQGKAIPVCPEVLAGLPIPRPCCEIASLDGDNIKVISKEGKDVTKEFLTGAEKALEIAKIVGVKKAILKSKSPSCGCGQIYDGTFSGKLIPGNGLTADLLIKNGIEVLTENDMER